MSTLSGCPSSISSSDHGVAHPPRCAEEESGEAVVACDISEQCKFQSLDSRQKRFLWTHKEADLAPHQVISLVFQEMRRSVPRHSVLKVWVLFSRVSQQGPCFTDREEDLSLIHI